MKLNKRIIVVPKEEFSKMRRETYSLKAEIKNLKSELEWEELEKEQYKKIEKAYAETERLGNLKYQIKDSLKFITESILIIAAGLFLIKLIF